MHKFNSIIEQVHESFETRTKVRDEMLKQARFLTRHCANAIRAVHRMEHETAQQHIAEARTLATSLSQNQDEHPDFFYAGYTQDALKEYAEAHLTYAFVNHQPIPTPEAINLEPVAYLKGMAEAAGELRRRSLDVLRQGDSDEAIYLLDTMDEIYTALVTMDYPNAITGGLRRMTDILRSIVERTRGDLTMSLRQERLEARLRVFEEKLAKRSAA
ncbi:MAG: haloacid dehalogenase [Anaerolineae bacterium]|nr:haloacid dehalogenase [Anaerolineae bacterium]